MTRIQWDQTGERLYETGVDRGVLYIYDAEKKKYTNGVAWNGLTAVTESPSGAEPNAFYADNIKYLNIMSTEEFGGTIEAYTYPEEFARCDGSHVENGVYVGQQARVPFGFAYRTLIGNDTEGNDYGEKIHVVWDAKAQPSEMARNTVNDTPEPTTMSWTFTTTPTQFKSDGDFKDLKPTAHIYIDSKKTDAKVYEKIKDLLWGTEGAEPTLPTPDELLAMAKGGATEVRGGGDTPGGTPGNQ